MKHLAACLIAAAAAAIPFAASADVNYYLVDSIATQSTQADMRAEAVELGRIYADLEQQSGVEAKLIYSSDPDINAFAAEAGDEKLVVVQEGLLTTMHGDRDAVAAVLGHELAHHKGDHIRAGRRKQESVRVLGSILGAVVGAKIGRNSGALAGTAAAAAVGVGAGLVALKFNRDQEIEADRLSVGWMIAAGYNPDGMLRLQQRLGELEGNSHAAIFSTHPTSAKRYQAAEKQIAKLAPPAELLAHDVVPLVSDAALAEATAQIRQADDERLAQVLKPDGDALDAEALAPIDSVSFDDYAALQNQLLFAGDQGESRLLASNHLDQARLTHLTEAFTSRMQENSALKQRYSVAFFRATQGKLAAHGRDLADSYESGHALQLDPPYPLDTASALFAEMSKRGAPSLDAAQQAAAEKEVLQPLGLSYYDFLIGHNWWSRKAKIAALSGDSSILQTYYGLAARGADDDAHRQAAKAGVHIGNNVHVGKNVHIGGQDVQTAADPDGAAQR